jgi:hypothetical protein
MKYTVSEKLDHLKEEAKKRGLRIRKDRRLTKTPYVAMHEYAGKELKQPYIKGTITYEPQSLRRKHKLCMDLNHEIIEYDLMRKGKRYKPAHKVANRKQRTFRIEK